MPLDTEMRSELQPPARRPLTAAPTFGLGATARVMQGVSQEFRGLTCATPLLIAVRQGSKTLRCEGRKLEVDAGDMAVLPAHLAVDIGNRPPRSGPYVAELLAFDPEFLRTNAAARPAATPRARIRLPALIARPPAGLQHAFRVAADALSAEPRLPPAIVAHRLAEPLVWLADLLNAVLLAPQTSMAARVRSILAGDPARSWSAAAVARQVGASAPTLRRKLAAESTGFAAILSDVRMSTALTLIQTTEAPISEVAAAVGYESPSRFAVGFRRRFGVAPSAIRGHQRD